MSTEESRQASRKEQLPTEKQREEVQRRPHQQQQQHPTRVKERPDERSREQEEPPQPPPLSTTTTTTTTTTMGATAASAAAGSAGAKATVAAPVPHVTETVEDFERTPSGRVRRRSAQVAVFHLQEIAEDELAKDWGTKRRIKDDLVPDSKRVRECSHDKVIRGYRTSQYMTSKHCDFSHIALGTGIYMHAHILQPERQTSHIPMETSVSSHALQY